MMWQQIPQGLQRHHSFFVVLYCTLLFHALCYPNTYVSSTQAREPGEPRLAAQQPVVRDKQARITACITWRAMQGGGRACADTLPPKGRTCEDERQRALPSAPHFYRFGTLAIIAA